MYHPPRVRRSTLGVMLALLAVSAVAACSGEAGADNENASFAIEVSQMYITVENRTGLPVVGGDVEIIPVGILPPFRSTLPRLESGGTATIPLNTFRGSGTVFNRNIANGRTVRVTATDPLGDVYEHEVPFD